jgi:hypothetical protein
MRPRRIVVRTEDIKEMALRLMEEYENVRISFAGHPLHRKLGLGNDHAVIEAWKRKLGAH